jgi:hypothetical protein
MGSISFSRKKQKEQDTHIVIDSTGVKVYGDGEWKRKKHGVEKRRKWKKLHVGMNEQGEIIAHEVTDEGTHDADVGRDMLKQSNATCFLGDGAFDHRKIYDICKERGIEPIVPPRKDAVFWSDKSHPRNTALGIIKQYGRDIWKQTSGYTKRSVIESLMWRYKSCFGDRITTRRSDNQRADILIGCQILNVFRTLGMPQSVAMA